VEQGRRFAARHRVEEVTGACDEPERPDRTREAVGHHQDLRAGPVVTVA
jgi:hypothetical protein